MAKQQFDYTPGVWYAITINPRVQYEDYKRSSTRVTKVTNDFASVFQDPRVHMILDFAVLAEVSTPKHVNRVTFPRMHYHGVIRIKNKRHFKAPVGSTNLFDFLMLLPKLGSFGDTLIKPIKDLDEWVSYCTKNFKQFKDCISPECIYRSNVHKKRSLFNSPVLQALFKAIDYPEKLPSTFLNLLEG